MLKLRAGKIQTFSDNVPLRNMCKGTSSASVTTFIPDRSRVCHFMRQQNNNDARNVKKHPGLFQDYE